mmetsp:Transcript_27326/g.72404  ORF Transcript_27326/g.72404 Transcript_27326/m.72404 type:complete len:313 (+) Transcript_27326:794-1732(+)
MERHGRLAHLVVLRVLADLHDVSVVLVHHALASGPLGGQAREGRLGEGDLGPAAVAPRAGPGLQEPLLLVAEQRGVRLLRVWPRLPRAVLQHDDVQAAVPEGRGVRVRALVADARAEAAGRQVGDLRGRYRVDEVGCHAVAFSFLALLVHGFACSADMVVTLKALHVPHVRLTSSTVQIALEHVVVVWDRYGRSVLGQVPEGPEEALPLRVVVEPGVVRAPKVCRGDVSVVHLVPSEEQEVRVVLRQGGRHVVEREHHAITIPPDPAVRILRARQGAHHGCLLRRLFAPDSAGVHNLAVEQKPVPGILVRLT